MKEIAVTQSKVKLKSTFEPSGSKRSSFIWCVQQEVSKNISTFPCSSLITRLVGVERVKNCSQRTQKVDDG